MEASRTGAVVGNGQQTHRNQIQFPSREPQAHQPRPMPATATTTPAHTRSSSFFAAFRSNKTHQRNVSAPPAPPQQIVGTSEEVLERPPVTVSANQRQQTPQNGQPPPRPQAFPTASTMIPPGQQQQQPLAANYQQPLPQVPLQQQQQPTVANMTAPAPDVSQPGAQPAKPPPPPATPLHPEVRSVVSLKASHAHKIYFSGPLVRRIERQPDGQRPNKDEGWTDVWAQLGGTILSVWDMKEVQEASRQGKEVPPAYVNVTDAFVQVLGSVTVPATTASGPKRYTNVLTLNTAGSNLLLFSCPSTPALISWAAALRLAAWEKSRLEELYTAHLIRITLPSRDVPTTLIRGKLEGWARIRIAGQTDWKRVWVSICQGNPDASNPSTLARSDSRMVTSPTPGAQPGHKKKRMSSLFSRDHSPQRSNLPAKPTITMFTGMKPKERKKPLLTVTDVTQAFGVYPERPDLISRSTLIKVEGLLGDDELAGTMKSREGWVLIMPELEAGPQAQAQAQPNLNLSKEMLKWIVALHDAFNMYGRPAGWTWDPRDPVSLMFGYPVGPNKEHLFLDREVVENMDPRDDRTSVIRSHLRDLLVDFMRSTTVQVVPRPGGPSQDQQSAPNDGPPTLPPINGYSGTPPPDQQRGQQHTSGGPQLPPLGLQDNRALTPITEGGSTLTHTNTFGGGSTTLIDAVPSNSGNQKLGLGLEKSDGADLPLLPPLDRQSPSAPQALDRDLSHSPKPMSPATTHTVSTNGRTSTPVTLNDTGSYLATAGGAAIVGGIVGTSLAKANGNGNGNNVPPSSPPAASTRPLSPIRKGTGASSGSPIPDQSSPQPSFQQSPRLIQQAVVQSQQAALPLTAPDDQMSRTFTSLSTTSTMSAATSNLSWGQEGDLFNNHQALHQQQQQQQQAQPPHASNPPVVVPTTADDSGDFTNEAGALFFMQNSSNNNLGGPPSMSRKAIPVYKDDDEPDSQSSDEEKPQSRLEQLRDPLGGAASQDAPLQHSTIDGQNQQGGPMASFERGSAINPANQPNEVAAPNRNFASSSPPPPSTTFSNPSSPIQVSSPTSGSRFADRPGRGPTTLANLGRKPSGARAPQSVVKGYSGGQVAGGPFSPSSSSQSRLQHLAQHDEASDEEGQNYDESSDRQPPHTQEQHFHQQSPQQQQVSGMSLQQTQPQGHKSTSSFDDGPNAEVLAALAYLEVDEQRREPRAPALPTIQQSDSMKDEGYTSASNNNINGLFDSSSGGSTTFKSTFAPSKNAEERKKKAQAQQAAQYAAAQRPGRAGGKKKRPPVVAGAWGDSSEEDEEEEEEEEDDDVDSDGGAPVNAPPRMQQQMRSASGQQQIPQQAFGAGSVYPNVEHPSDNQYNHLRPPRNLPQIPAGRSMTTEELQQSGTRRQGPDQYTDGGRRTYYDDGMGGQSGRVQGDAVSGNAARQTVWSQVLDANRSSVAPFVNPNDQPARDTFVQLEPSETMTKAFTPQGLLSAGLQDKQDRSAKRQEELARETGASLINVPNKPPPPQTGLLGAITAHERERKREGGVGAALTEREREKRVAEERQRRFDEHQRVQLDQMQQGSMYGGPPGQSQFGMMNPMMNPMMMGGMNPMMGLSPMMTGGGLNPMMTGGGMNPMMAGGGMNPMMTGGGMNPMMGYGMMGGYNPQHLFAAQQAAQAYQQAMMAFSVAGSQIGGENGGAQGQLNPNMTGNFDPRMSMNMMGMGMMGPMPMQMSGGGMDPRFSVAGGGMGMGMGGMGMAGGSPGNLGETIPLSGPLGGTPPLHTNNLSPGHFTPTSNGNSPVGRGSPLARVTPGSEGLNESRGISRSASPKA